MPLDPATLRFCSLLRHDLERMAERADERIARGHETEFDPVSGLALVQTRHGDPIARLYGEVLATYMSRDRILRWAWAGRSEAALPMHGDLVFRTGHARGVPQLAMSVVADLDVAEATTLVQLGALVARAEGVHPRTVGADIEYIGLFERARPTESAPAPEHRYSLPPAPSVVSHARSVAPGPVDRRVSGAWSNLGPAGTSNSARPPNTESAAARPQEPMRAHVLPVANLVLAELTQRVPGYRQGLFQLTVDPAELKKPAMHLAVLDASGVLRAMDVPASLVEAAVTMVLAVRRENNGTWMKLAVRITPKPDGGATLHVDVS